MNGKAEGRCDDGVSWDMPSAAMNDNSTPAPLLAVFAFLDELLSAEAREALSTTEVHKDMPDFLAYRSFTREAYKLVRDSFMQANGLSPVCSLLADFHLFHETDRAAAVTWAYALHLQGKNVLEALTADYAFNWKAVLREIPSPDQSLSFNRPDFPEWRRLVVPTDRWAECHTPGRRGIIVLRGDRLLCAKVTMYYTCHSDRTPLDGEWERYQAQGGHKAFFAGTLHRPPKPPASMG